INGDAFDLQATLGNFSGLTFYSVVSGIPLLNFPMAKRISLLESIEIAAAARLVAVARDRAARQMEFEQRADAAMADK
ncbi:hypothetical protein ACC756_39200, partial [Rhizobium ruizarguesonis]